MNKEERINKSRVEVIEREALEVVLQEIEEAGEKDQISIDWNEDMTVFTSNCECGACKAIRLEIDWDNQQEALVRIQFLDHEGELVKATLGLGQLLSLAPRMFHLGMVINEAVDLTQAKIGLGEIIKLWVGGHKEQSPDINTTDRGEA